MWGWNTRVRPLYNSDNEKGEMMHLLKKISLVAAIFAAPVISNAADATNPAWQFEVAPYLWAVNMNGRIGVGPVTAHLSDDFAELLSQLNVGGMLWLGAHKGPFGLFLNSLYVVLDDNAMVNSGNVSERTYFGLFTAGISYIALQKQLDNQAQLQLEPYIGDRYTLNNVRINVLNRTLRSDHHWQNPIVGLRVTYNWTPQWVLQVSGDAGGTNASSNYSYNVAALLGYHPISLKHTTFYLGYRNLYQVYKTGRGINYFNWNMRQFGPLVGVNFSFG